MSTLEKLERRGMAGILAVAVVLAAFAPVCLLAEETDADAAEPDYTFYRYTIKFFSTSSDAEFLVWDFADGTVLDGRWEHYAQMIENGDDVSEEIAAGVEAYKALLAQNGNSIYCPIHTYAEKGTYTYSITAYNPVGYVSPEGMTYDGVFSTDETGYDGGLISGSDDITVCGSKDTATVTLAVMGYPVISFDTDGGSEIAPMTVENGETYTSATAPADPTKDDLSFGGWFLDEGCTLPYDWSKPVERDTVLYASWVNPSDPGDGTVRITVNGRDTAVDGGSRISDIEVQERDGFEFMGWYSDAACTVPVDVNAPVTQGMSLYAKYAAIDDGSSDDTASETEDIQIAPIVCMAMGIIVLIAGLRFHPLICLFGVLVLAVGGADYLGILGVF